MAVDTPARIAILGAGPIGLEAALYARFLGYAVDIYERGVVAESVLRWGHVRMFTPFGMNRSNLGLAALLAHDENFASPDDEPFLTGTEWANRYLIPLAQTDLLGDHIHLGKTVVAVGREGLRKGDLLGHEDRGDYTFRLLLRDADGNESIEPADVVIDATGTFGNANGAGQGGIKAIGETALRDKIEYGLPDVLGSHRDGYAQRKTLVIGAGPSAATTIVALAHLATEAPGTQVTWLVRRPLDEANPGPVRIMENDPLLEWAKLATVANACAMGDNSAVTLFADTALHAVRHDSTADKFTVELIGEHAGQFEFDRIVANVGFRPDNQAFFDELHVDTGHVCLPPETLLTGEPHFYILGAKSFGRNPNFLYQIGLGQIRDLFKIIGDRPSLDLYASG